MLVAFGTDDGFVRPTAVAARSVDRFLTSDDTIAVFGDRLGDPDISALAETVQNARFRFIDGADDLDPRWVPPSHVTRAAFFRYVVGDVFPDQERCLYLDGDVLVRHPPTAIHDHDLEGAVMAAVRSRVAPFLASPGGVRVWFELGLAGAMPYFNSGVLVIDLENWRRRQMRQKLTAFLEQYGDTTWHADQEALNAIAAGDWVELPRTANYITHVGESFLQQPEAEYADPTIVHFAGRAKPWSYERKPMYSEEWYALLEQTPFAGWRPSPPAPPTGLGAGARRAAGRALRGLRELARE